MQQRPHAMSTEEKRQLDEQGYVLRREAFARRETEALIDAGESLIARLIRDRSAPRQRYGSYTFDGDVENGVMIKWEGDSDVVHGIEPFAHLSIELANAAADARFIEPMQDILDCAKPMLFTEKLNLKRAHDGGINPLHQDFPYWLNVAENAAEVATAMLFLDDADQDNGCLYVVPGSHARGEWVLSESDDRFARHELSEHDLGDFELVPVEVSAGSMIFFGPYLLHQSAPNRSARERRALLFSYQPPGRVTQREVLTRALRAMP